VKFIPKVTFPYRVIEVPQKDKAKVAPSSPVECAECSSHRQRTALHTEVHPDEASVEVDVTTGV
jgi:hypothetical protein